MHALLTLLIVAIHPAAPNEAGRAAVGEVFSCSFDDSWDLDYDGWPDEWTRRRGPGFPRYVGIRISREPTPSGDRCLRIDLDGGGAVAYSPPIPVSSLYRYVLECQASTEGLKHDRAYLSVTLLDESRHRLETVYSERVCQTEGWKTLRLGPISADPSETRLAVLGLHLEPGAKADLTGVARFADVRLSRMLRMELSLAGTAEPVARHLFASGEGLSVVCRASGFGDASAWVTFRLTDVHDQTLIESCKPLAGEPAALAGPDASLGVESEQAGLCGSVQWSLPALGPGFYRVHASMARENDVPLGSAEATLAVIEPLDPRRWDEFGWTLPAGGGPYAWDELAGLIEQSAVGRLKCPLWFDAETQPQRLDEFIRFRRQLFTRGTEIIGLLADPPFDVPGRLDPSQPPSAAEIFSLPAELWSPSLEPLMRGLATEVRRWQLGVDADISFVGYPGLAEKIRRIKAELERMAPGAEIGLSWPAADGLPPDGGQPPPWRFVVLSGQNDEPERPAPSENGLGENHIGRPLDHENPVANSASAVERWIALEPLDRGHPAQERATDLVQQVVAAKLSLVQGVIVPDVFSSERGLLNGDGTPSELLLAWRTTAQMLGGTVPLGSIQLPGESSNQLFARGDEVVMVVWNDRPREEVIHLGSDVRQIDLWGRSRPVPIEAGLERIAVEPAPSFLVGIDGRAVRWRQHFQLASDRLPSTFGRPIPNELRLANPLDHEAEGVLVLVAPPGWRVDPPQVRFKLAPGEELRQPAEFTLPYTTTAGRHALRADFEIAGEPPLRFSAYRQVDVGLGNVTIEVSTRLNDAGELEVRQELVNHDRRPVSFRCLLFAPERRRLKSAVIDQGPGADVQTYTLPQGAELLGKPLWLRAQDLNDGSTLNYRFVAEP